MNLSKSELVPIQNFKFLSPLFDLASSFLVRPMGIPICKTLRQDPGRLDPSSAQYPQQPYDKLFWGSWPRHRRWDILADSMYARFSYA